MSNLHNLQGVVKEMTSKSHHVIQTKHENRQANNGDKYTCFCEESFIDRLFSVLEFLGGALCASFFSNLHFYLTCIKIVGTL